ncbi:MAG: carbohydrate kinase family protein [Chitinophagaceae bacterium]|nr:carbohydrate kinase family protein [Chitinophagaceae bacterium]
MSSEKKFDVIVIGELNADLILNQIESFPEVGKEKLAESMTLTLGSSSAIFAGNLSTLGMRVAFIGKIGNDILGSLCKEELERKKVDTSMIISSTELKTGATVILNFGEDRAMITYQGAMKHLGITDITKEMLSMSKHLHFSSYFLQPGFKNSLAGLFKMAKETGLTTSLDIQWDPSEQWNFDYETILPHVDIFFPNEKEMLHLTKAQSLEAAISTIAKWGNYIVVKRGKDGSLLSYNNQLIHGRPFVNKTIVDAIGAGDSFNAGYIFKFIKGCSPEDCQTFGNLTGAISTTASGGTTAFTDLSNTMKIAKEIFGYEE